MATELKKKLESLRAATAKLNASTDEAGRIIQQVERFLGEEMGIGISADTAYFLDEPYEGDDQDEAGWIDEVGNPARPDVCHALGYGRIGGKYRIHVITTLEGHKTNSHNGLTRHTTVLDRTPWASCPRDLKLTAFPVLPKLLERLADRAKELASQADSAAKTVEDLMGTHK